MTETWKKIPGYPAYEISTMGQVRSWKIHRGRPGPRILTMPADSKGYLTARIYDPRGRGRTFKVHVLVMLAFAGPRPNGLEIRHLDSNCQNNRLENLAYGTATENIADRIALKTHCKQGHPLSGPNTYYRPNGARACRECLRAADRRRRAKQKASA